MCQFCEGKKRIIFGMTTLVIKDGQMQVYTDGQEAYATEIDYCPKCGEVLRGIRSEPSNNKEGKLN